MPDLQNTQAIPDQPRYLLRVAFGSSVLLDTRHDHDVFTKHGEAAYVEQIRKTENKPYESGVLFPLAMLLLHINRLSGMRIFDLVLVSKNHSAASLKVETSLTKLGLADHGQFALGPTSYNRGHDDDVLGDLGRLKADVYFGSDAALVTRALTNGIAAAHFTPGKTSKAAMGIVRQILKTNSLNTLFALSEKSFQIFTDFDGVLADWSSENFYEKSVTWATRIVDKLIKNGELKTDQRDAEINRRSTRRYVAHEAKLMNKPVSHGPFAPLIVALSHFVDVRPITMRADRPKYRAQKTLNSWGLENLGLISMSSTRGTELSKAELMKPKDGSGPTRVPLLFLEDSGSHIHLARLLGIDPTGHVRRTAGQEQWKCHTNSLARVFAFAKTLRSKGLTVSRALLSPSVPEPV